MESNTRDHLFEKAKEFVYEAGQRIKDQIDQPRKIETKSNPNDLVTEMDQNTEKFFAESIRNEFPEHRLFGEEGFGDDIKDLNGIVWIVDPIDGTMNFVHQKRNFAISVGIYEDGVGEIGVIYDVMGGALYTAVRGGGAFKNETPMKMNETKVLEETILALNTTWLIPENPHVEHKGVEALVKRIRSTRSYGSAALEFVYVAEGIIDGYLTMTLMPWDIAAGRIIVNEAGGIVTTADGEELDMLNKTTVLASHPDIHSEIVENYVDLKQRKKR
ncbi:inositol monophosphatase family protein [Halobacillus sp. A5]|uniref:inositol monophosphatase family protein n=1 Tax=Halobacillus sp. A5 TaxID=2880263 RepID=UPI0020A66E69|nr:inositol monophosphatase family protein [Halobacillus sp. A5]MCP3026256.1 inositol monophosphatase family protein [Halobacillus sp. A5]